MDETLEEGFDVLDALDIPESDLDCYDKPSIDEEGDLERPVYIEPGIYKGQLIEWGKVYNPMFKKILFRDDVCFRQ